jgi:hypothetical protein
VNIDYDFLPFYLYTISQAICERRKTSSFYPKFVGSSMTNVTLSVLKDKAFAAMFGTGVARPMSYTSMGKNFRVPVIVKKLIPELLMFLLSSYEINLLFVR